MPNYQRSPITRRDAGWRDRLNHDHDGVVCEQDPRSKRRTNSQFSDICK
ncbi:excalibur calcium-binding domain-containing protein [Corynebacterium matruchotii]